MAPLFIKLVTTVAISPITIMKKIGERPPKIGSNTAINMAVMPLSSALIAADRGCTSASSRMMPHVTPESTIFLNGRSGLPSTLIQHITVTKKIQIPVLPMADKNLVRKKDFGKKLGINSMITKAKRKHNTIFCILFKTKVPS